MKAEDIIKINKKFEYIGNLLGNDTDIEYLIQYYLGLSNYGYIVDILTWASLRVKFDEDYLFKLFDYSLYSSKLFIELITLACRKDYLESKYLGNIFCKYLEQIKPYLKDIEDKYKEVYINYFPLNLLFNKSKEVKVLNYTYKFDKDNFANNFKNLFNESILYIINEPLRNLKVAELYIKDDKGKDVITFNLYINGTKLVIDDIYCRDKSSIYREYTERIRNKEYEIDGPDVVYLDDLLSLILRKRIPKEKRFEDRTLGLPLPRNDIPGIKHIISSGYTLKEEL